MRRIAAAGGAADIGSRTPSSAQSSRVVISLERKITGRPLPGWVPPPTVHRLSNPCRRWCGRLCSIWPMLCAMLNVAPCAMRSDFQSAGVTSRSARMRRRTSVMPNTVSSWRIVRSRSSPLAQCQSTLQSPALSLGVGTST